MGSLYYANFSDPIEIPDRLLAHLKVVIATKLRRGESFTLSWRNLPSEGGRSTLWLQPAIPLRFLFDGDEAEILNPAFMRELAASANSSGGLAVALDQEIPEVEDSRVSRMVPASA